MVSTPLKRLMYVGDAEGISFLVLLLIAMPLKYMFDIPEAVSVVGSLHGALFVLYMLTILNAFLSLKWTIGRSALAVAVAFVPFGTFLFNRMLKRKYNLQPVQV
ncbi:membrane protein [Pontibacillus halophilus JSM 076056 = DSM 19796]|uniref:Membrane protein n=1 Tax=Pontibacillus halophilus JSM 076056 = DSM 19796 TaxID=1385510 RepID=A0A0A5I9F0_9BACI|nr:DUF3817 domain-containing protein [Pontibacillus halophilus]KGX92457.1 membrane protein [Pontibacillus halophilus JSM 076056 = DSM 19796]